MSIHFVFDGREITGIDLIFYFIIDIRRIGLPHQIRFDGILDGLFARF